jgi:hypothetical protein
VFYSVDSETVNSLTYSQSLTAAAFIRWFDNSTDNRQTTIIILLITVTNIGFCCYHLKHQKAMPTGSHAELHQVGWFATNCTDNSYADCTSHCSQHTLHSTPYPMTFAGDSRAGNLPVHITSALTTPCCST